MSPHVSPAVLSLADKVRAVALEGLKYAHDPYDQARYESLLEMAAAPFADALDLDIATLKNDFRKELGCVTPKLGADAAVLDDQRRLLVLRRTDDTGWCLPCGWVNVGESPATAAVREVHEETGLETEATGYIALSTKGPGQTQNVQHQVNILVAMRLISNPADLKLSHEHTEYQWITRPVQLDWHPGHDKQVYRIFHFLHGGAAIMLPAL